MGGTRMIVWQLCVTLFFFWHAFAVGIYAIPTEATDITSNYIRDVFSPYVSPYLLITSQWQQWNLFSPDPLRRITYYHVSAEFDGEWENISTIEPGTFPWWQHALQFKLLSHLLEPHQEDLVQRYIQHVCHTQQLPVHTPVRLEAIYSIIPWLDVPQSIDWWRSWSPEFATDWIIDDYCSPS